MKRGLQGNSERLRKEDFLDEDKDYTYDQRRNDTQDELGFISLNVPLN